MGNSARSAASGRFQTRRTGPPLAAADSDPLLSEAPARKRARLDLAPTTTTTTTTTRKKTTTNLNNKHRNHRLKNQIPPAPSPLSSSGPRKLRSTGSPAAIEPLNHVARPPSRLGITKPHAPIKETINGVRSKLDIREDEIPEIKPIKAKPAELKDYNKPAENATPPICHDDDKRVLRSQDGGSRSKSDLVRFFPDYEDVVFGPEKDPDILTVESTLFIAERKAKTQELPIRQLTSPSKDTKTPQTSVPENVQQPIASPAPRPRPTGPPYRRLDFSPYVKEAEELEDDPLSDDFYFLAHKRGERKEKQLRNIEKEHAMHEKGDLERLLGELRGPDWLKAMGISGITETEKKSFEPKRDYYLRRVKGLLDKFSIWREQEKEMKMKREQALALKEEEFPELEDESEPQQEEAGAEEEEEVEEEEEGEEVEVEEEEEEEDDDEEEEADEEEESEEEEAAEEEPDATVEQSASSGVDEAALQLQQEAKLFTGPRASKSAAAGKVLPQSLSQPERSFTSFYQKPYLRTAAIGKHRRGRSVTAFGHPVPELAESEFELPNDYVTEEALIANARKRRRLKRQTKDD